MNGDRGRRLMAWVRRRLCVLCCKTAPGIGHYLRNNTEHAIFATRGKPMTPEEKPMATWYEWSRGAHSAKPPAFYDLVEQVTSSERTWRTPSSPVRSATNIAARPIRGVAGEFYPCKPDIFLATYEAVDG